MPNIFPHPKRPLLPSFLSGSHKPTSRSQLENQAREEACKKKSETASQTERADRILRKQEQEQIRQEQEDIENKERETLNAQGLIAQEARKVKAVRRDKALPEAPWDEGLREKYGIFYE